MNEMKLLKEAKRRMFIIGLGIGLGSCFFLFLIGWVVFWLTL